MHRTDGDSHVANLFDEGDPGVPRAPTQVDAAWLNAVQEELCNAITNAGIALVKGTNTQLRAALVNILTDQTIAGVKTFSGSVQAVQMSITKPSGGAIALDVTNSTSGSGMAIQGTANTATTAISGVNSGTGSAGSFTASNTTSGAVEAFCTTSAGKAIRASNLSTGPCATFAAHNTTGYAVEVTCDAAGTTLRAENSGSSGKAGSFGGSPGSPDAVVGVTSGGAGQGISVVNTSSGDGVQIITDSGEGLTSQSSSGYAASLIGNATCSPLHLGPLADFPSTYLAGDIFYNSGTSKLYVRTSGGWEQITSA